MDKPGLLIGSIFFWGTFRKKKSKGKKTTVETSLACRFLDGHADSAGDKPGL